MPVDTIIAGLLHNSGSNHIYAVVAALLLAIFVTNAVRKKKTKGFEAPRVEGGEDLSISQALLGYLWEVLSFLAYMCI